MTDAREELGQLTAAFRAELRRRRALGWRRTGRATTGAISVQAPGAAPPARAPEPPHFAPSAQKSASTEAVQTRPSPAHAPTPAPAPAQDRASDLEQAVAAIRSRAAAAATLEELREAVAGCTACSLSESRTQTVFADGEGSAGVMFVGEAPGYHEDAQGVPFVGPAGELLTSIIEKGMRLERKTVTICNVLKCRPPENRDPTAQEKALCTPWLDRQIELSSPKVIIPLGKHASGHLLQSEAPLGQMRGRIHLRDGRPVVPTYHPAYLLRSPEMKPTCWKDIQLAMGVLKPADGQAGPPR
ncbi:MAG: uracil-DNA glycosylase family 4 [Chlamydiales bacterium]|jgi:uracil-DNA glycosylase family 4